MQPFRERTARERFHISFGSSVLIAQTRSNMRKLATARALLAGRRFACVCVGPYRRGATWGALRHVALRASCSRRRFYCTCVILSGVLRSSRVPAGVSSLMHSALWSLLEVFIYGEFKTLES